jgi:hypothetical protein
MCLLAAGWRQSRSTDQERRKTTESYSMLMQKLKEDGGIRDNFKIRHWILQLEEEIKSELINIITKHYFWC